jgi:hypothetical protein
MLADAAWPHLLHRRRRVLPLPATHALTVFGWSNPATAGPGGLSSSHWINAPFTAHEISRLDVILALEICKTFEIGGVDVRYCPPLKAAVIPVDNVIAVPGK